MRSASRLAAVLSLSLASCAWFSSEEEDRPPAEEGAQSATVVADGGPFDPAQAVDDEDDGTDASASSEAAPVASSKDDEELAKPGPGEHVATPGEVAALAKEREQVKEAVEADEGVDDDAAKAATAQNPPREDPGDVDVPFMTATDYVMESLLLVALAFALSLFLGLARRRPARAAVVGVGVASLAVGLVALL